MSTEQTVPGHAPATTLLSHFNGATATTPIEFQALIYSWSRIRRCSRPHHSCLSFFCCELGRALCGREGGGFFSFVWILDLGIDYPGWIEMEMRIGNGEAIPSHSQTHNLPWNGVMVNSSYSPPLRMSLGKRSNTEWDSNHWRWDGDLFMASPTPNNPTITNHHPNYNHPDTSSSKQFLPLVGVASGSSNSSPSCSNEPNLSITGKGKLELEKRRRIAVFEEEATAGNLSLKLGNGNLPSMMAYHHNREEVSNGGGDQMKTKLGGSVGGGGVCQVEECGADLTSAKDYHRRHKVCEMHSKVTSALVASVLQRFCQQCSRFHVLQEFDEGKRSCRKRLAGHNKRRRKTQPDAVVHNSTNDGQTSSYILMSLLKTLSNMHSNQSSQTSDQDLLSHLLRSLINQRGLHGDKSLSGFPQDSHNLLNSGTFANSDVVAALLTNAGPPRHSQQNLPVIASEVPQSRSCPEDVKAQHIRTEAFQNHTTVLPKKDSPPYSGASDSSAGRSRLHAFDLNDAYIDSDDCTEDVERSLVTVDVATASIECPTYVQQDSDQSSPPQRSGNSDSTATQSPASSCGEALSRTDRIVIKLFGKEPSDLPFLLRAQILDWLSHSPSDIEGYIRPGCLVLTIYLRLTVSAWEELCYDLTNSLNMLLDAYEVDNFWAKGWIYFRMQQQIAFSFNGQIVAETSLPLKNERYSSVLNVKPIAVPIADRAQFFVKGYNLKRSSTRLLCALEGNYLIEETSDELLAEDVDCPGGNGNIQCRRFSCSIPVVNGRGFIEVEDGGLSSSFFPFIVAEEDVCSEIRMLEQALELTETDDIHHRFNTELEARNQALEFIHEMGWLLHRNHLKSRLGDFDLRAEFTVRRLKWLMEFSIDRDWYAVVRKLLNALLDGTVDAGELKLAMSDMGLLHRAVRRNSRPLVEFLLRYVPERVSDELGSQFYSLVGGEGDFLFKPDFEGPAGLTPLHIAAGRDDSEDVLDALTDDPGKVGVKAWKSARDSTGFTPEDYARLRGHYSYIHLVQGKINRRSVTGHVVIDIPRNFSNGYDGKKLESEKLAGSLQIDSNSSKKGACRVCERQLTVYGNLARSSSLAYRPAMLSMVAIAAVCVCVALLFKTCPEVVYVFHPFRWEMLEFGSS